MSTAVAPVGPARVLFIDRLRVLLTVLVIAHHAAITYGASGSWFLREAPAGAGPAGLLLTLFAAVNQSFFMGMFFLLAGYHTPGAWRRHGAAGFLRERLLRLGLPLLAFGCVLGPLTVALAGAAQGRPVLERWLALLGQGRFVLGPLWFAWALLLFSAGWVAWATMQEPRRWAAAEDRPLPGPRAWLLSALAVGAAAVLLRLWVPVGETVLGLQLGYFASYVFLYALGCRAAADRWLERVQAADARRWRRVAWLALPVLPVASLVGNTWQGAALRFEGGWGWPALLYAFWEPLVAWGLIASLLHAGRLHLDRPGPRWDRWAARAYGAFVVHAPVLVGLSVLARPWPLPALLKFALVTVAATGLSFAAAGWLRALPGVRRVL